MHVLVLPALKDPLRHLQQRDMLFHERLIDHHLCNLYAHTSHRTHNLRVTVGILFQGLNNLYSAGLY